MNTFTWLVIAAGALSLAGALLYFASVRWGTSASASTWLPLGFLLGAAAALVCIPLSLTVDGFDGSLPGWLLLGGSLLALTGGTTAGLIYDYNHAKGPPSQRSAMWRLAAFVAVMALVAIVVTLALTKPHIDGQAVMIVVSLAIAVAGSAFSLVTRGNRVSPAYAAIGATGAFAALALVFGEWEAAVGAASGLVCGLAATYGVLSLKGSRALLRLRQVETRSPAARAPSQLVPTGAPTPTKPAQVAVSVPDEETTTARIERVHALMRLRSEDPREVDEVVSTLSTLIRLWGAAEPAVPEEVRAAVIAIGRFGHSIDLSGANLPGLILTGTILDGSVLTGANLEGAILERVSLAGARLTRINFRNAILHEVDLRGATLFGADLSGATLDDSYLENAKLHGAIWDDATRWPAGFEPPRRKDALRQ